MCTQLAILRLSESPSKENKVMNFLIFHKVFIANTFKIWVHSSIGNGQRGIIRGSID